MIKGGLFHYTSQMCNFCTFVKQMTVKGIDLISYVCVCVHLVAQLCPTLVTP